MYYPKAVLTVAKDSEERTTQILKQMRKQTTSTPESVARSQATGIFWRQNQTPAAPTAGKANMMMIP